MQNFAESITLVLCTLVIIISAIGGIIVRVLQTGNTLKYPDGQTKLVESVSYPSRLFVFATIYGSGIGTVLSFVFWYVALKLGSTSAGLPVMLGVIAGSINAFVVASEYRLPQKR